MPNKKVTQKILSFRHQTWVCAALLACCTALSTDSAAQTYPEKPVRLIVPFAPGGTTDSLARKYAELLGDSLGQSVIVENRPGASGNIGNRAVANAAADGYTLLFGSGQMTQTVTFGPFPAVPPEELQPISLVAESPQIIATSTKSPYKNIDELLSAARESPGSISLATAQLHIYAALLEQRADVKLLHIPYKGGALALMDTVGGRTDLVMSQAPVLLPFLKSGELRALGVMAKQRVAIMVDVPTFEEAGVKELEVISWFGVFAPAGTSNEVVDRLASETAKVVESPAMEQMVMQGLQIRSSTPKELAARVKREIAYWRQVGEENPDLLVAR